MKKIELTNDDIERFIADRVAKNPARADELNQYRHISSLYLAYINNVIGFKYNQPNDQNTSKQRNSAHATNEKRRYRTYTTIKAYCESHKYNDALTVFDIAHGTKLHINTVRNFINKHKESYNNNHTVSVMELLRLVFSNSNEV